MRNDEADMGRSDSDSDADVATSILLSLFIPAAEDSASSTLLNSPGGCAGVEFCTATLTSMPAPSKSLSCSELNNRTISLLIFGQLLWLLLEIWDRAR